MPHLDPKENDHLLRFRVAKLEALASADMELPPQKPERVQTLIPQQMAL